MCWRKSTQFASTMVRYLSKLQVKKYAKFPLKMPDKNRNNGGSLGIFLHLRILKQPNSFYYLPKHLCANISR